MSQFKEYQVGHKVMLILDGAQYITGDMKRFNQQTFRVSKVRHLKQKGTTHYWTYYELDGCESKKGVPYSIPGDWLYDIGAWVE